MTEQALSFFSFILPTWTINSAITTFNSCWKDHYLFFFLNTWQDPALWGRGSLVWKIEPGVLSGFVCFGENRSVTVKHTSKTDGLFALSYFCFGDQSDSRFQCWRAIHCAHSGGDVHHLDSLRWAAQKCHDGASSQFDEQHCFFSPAKQMGFTFRFKWDKQDDYKILYCAVIIFIFYTWLQIRSLVPVLAVEGKFKKRSFKHFISHNSGVRLFKSTTTKPPYAVRKQHAFPRLSESYCIILYLHRCGNRQ